MATASLCDHRDCRRTARRYVVASSALEKGKFQVDLCDQHDRPVRLLEEIAKKAHQATRETHGKITPEYLESLIERQ